MRWVITHRIGHVPSPMYGLRVLTFAATGDNSYESEQQANAAIRLWSGPEGLQRVLTNQELGTLEAREVEVWESGDPKRTVWDEDGD